ncbi:MAG: M24 family metallopeptidase, partial [Phycisphaerae bacterium]
MARRSSARAVPQQIARRLRDCRQQMRSRGLSAYLVTGQADQYYLTGFSGTDGAVLITQRAVYLITDGRFDKQADIEAAWARKVVRHDALESVLARLVRRLRLERIGIQAEHISLQQFRRLRRTVRPARLVATSRVVEQLRVCKDRQEIEAIRRAVQIAEEAFKITCRSIRRGMTERQVAARLDYEMQRLGAAGSSFATIVAEGPATALPHARPADRRIAHGSVLLIDWGARVGFYCSDLTRVIFVGRIPPRLGRAYQVVLDAQLRAIRAVGPQVPAAQVDAVARQAIERAGYRGRFAHGLGHGIGLEVHEQPQLSWRSQERLRAGMVITIEP